MLTTNVMAQYRDCRPRLRRGVKLVRLLIAKLDHERGRILLGLDVPLVPREQHAAEEVLGVRELRAGNHTVKLTEPLLLPSSASARARPAPDYILAQQLRR